MTTIDAGKGAEVVWQGETLPATTPLPLPCGQEVLIEILAPGHVRELKKVVADGSPKITKRLHKAEFLIYVDSKPSGAEVWVGARSFGRTPTWVPLPVGKTSTLRLTKQGYEDASHRVAQTDDGLRIELPLKSIAP